MIRQPEVALEHFRECSRGHAGHHVPYLAKVLTAADFQELADCVVDRRTLVSCSDIADRIGSRYFQMALGKALPAMFDGEELQDYFFDVLVSMHEDEDNWERRHKNELYKLITGGDGCFSKSRANPLQEAFWTVYNSRFIKFHRYPSQLADRAVSAIESNRSLAAVYRELSEKYLAGPGSSFLNWLANCVLPRVGEERFAEYLRAMLEEYAAGLPSSSHRHFSYSRLTTYIFGFSWAPMEKVNKYAVNSRGEHRDYYRLNKIIVREFLPYTIAVTTRRGAAFDILGLPADERRGYDEKANAIARNVVPAGLIAAGDARLPEMGRDEAAMLDRVLGALDSYMDGRFLADDAPRGPVPCLWRIRNAFGRALAEEDAALAKDFRKVRRTNRLACIFDRHLESRVQGVRTQRFAGNAADVDSDRDEVWLYYPNGDSFNGAKIDYSVLRSPALRQDARSYVRHLYREASSNGDMRSLGSLSRRANVVLSMLSALHEQFGVEEPGEVTDTHMLVLLSQTCREGRAEATVSDHLTKARAFFGFLRQTGRVEADPTLNIHVKRGLASSGSTPEIPEDILVFIEDHIDEVRPVECRLIFKIAMETGWRISDIRSILVEDIEGSLPAGGEPVIETRSPKTVAARIKLCLGDRIFAVVSHELQQEIIGYVEETAAQREIYGVETLFFCISNGVKTAFPASRFNNSINGLLAKHRIKSVCEDYGNFTSRQTRKTVAVELITSGAPPAAVQKQLGHTSQRTTELIYAQVRSKKLAELNHEFYQRKFGLLFDGAALDLYTEEERRLLYVDFCMNRRDVELGVCAKHPSEGRCADLGSINCACCPKLCTGRAYRERWEALRAGSAELLSSFVAKYDELSIPTGEYEDFIEYRQERALLQRYEAVLDAIDRGGQPCQAR